MGFTAGLIFSMCSPQSVLANEIDRDIEMAPCPETWNQMAVYGSKGLKLLHEGLIFTSEC